MQSLTKLICGGETESDGLRYGLGPGALASGRMRKPVVVWMATRSCNLSCRHCYSNSRDRLYPGELTMAEAVGLMRDLGAFGVPAVLVSGGEPLRRGDLFEVLGEAVAAGVRPTLSSNGTLVTREMAGKIKDAGVVYVGVSLDGVGEIHDRFRGRRGAFDETIAGIRNLRDAGQRVGLRLTLTKRTDSQLDEIFDLILRESIDRACFYHLVPVGRGKVADDLEPPERRAVMSKLIERTTWLYEQRPSAEVLTVGNPPDAAFVYGWVAANLPERAGEVRAMLEWNGGAAAGSGVGVGAVDADGGVHPDQFWQHYTLGNVRERPFSAIWSDESAPLLAELRADDRPLPGVCRSCSMLPVCGGGMRVRAGAAGGALWAEDPSCFLDDAERALLASA